MGDNAGIQLFADDSQDFQMPSLANEINSGELTDEEIEAKLMGDNQHLVTQGVEKAILGDTVKSLLIPEDTEIYLPNFVLDFSEATQLRQHQVEALDSLITVSGDTAVYIYINSGMQKLGMTNGSDIESILPVAIMSIFGDKEHKNCVCKLYKDVERGKPIRELKEADITTIRLKL